MRKMTNGHLKQVFEGDRYYGEDWKENREVSGAHICPVYAAFDSFGVGLSEYQDQL